MNMNGKSNLSEMVFDDDLVKQEKEDAKKYIEKRDRNQKQKNPMWGKKQSDATKQKISDSQRKRYAAIRTAVKEQEEKEQQAIVLTKDRICKSIKQIIDELMNEGR